MSIKHLSLIALLVFVISSTPVSFAAKPSSSTNDAAKQTVFGELKNVVLSTGAGRIRLMQPSGEITWSCKAGNAHDCWMLENGNILFADGRVTEINPETDEIVWQYTPEGKKSEAYACQRLADGVTLVGDNTTGRILEIDKDGKIIFEMKVEPFRAGFHHNTRMVRKLKNGNYLVCHSGEHVVREYTPKGEIVFEVKLDNIAFSAVRLENGNTLIGHIDHLTEYDPKGEVVWQFSNQDIEGVKITMMCDLHVLPNGNIAVGVYSAYKDGQGTGLFEITRDKKLVWRYSDPSADRCMMGIQVLDPEGKPQSDFPLR